MLSEQWGLSGIRQVAHQRRSRESRTGTTRTIFLVELPDLEDELAALHEVVVDFVEPGSGCKPGARHIGQWVEEEPIDDLGHHEP